MNLYDLIEQLQELAETEAGAPVKLATQPNWPLAYGLAGVYYDDQTGTVWLVEGEQTTTTPTACRARLGRGAEVARRVIGYVRVSTDKQEVGPEVQIDQLTEWAAREGVLLSIRREDAASAKSITGRPVLLAALADLRAGRADALAVAKLDRLSRDVADFATILRDSDRQGWDVVCLDLDVDTRTVTGRAMAQVTATFAEMERRRIGERTREGMAKIRRETGKHMGRPRGSSHLDPAARARVAELRATGLTLQGVADQLNAEGVPTSAGGRWWPSNVSRALAPAVA